MNVGIPFLQSLQMPEDFQAATDRAIESYKGELKTFYSDKVNQGSSPGYQIKIQDKIKNGEEF